MPGTVTLACTLPNGIVLRQADGSCPAVVLKGWAQCGLNQGTVGTAFTSGVPADVWATWSANNRALVGTVVFEIDDD
jgi:hypothetical protein